MAMILEAVQYTGKARTPKESAKMGLLVSVRRAA
jgi:hypothetical protein